MKISNTMKSMFLLPLLLVNVYSEKLSKEQLYSEPSSYLAYNGEVKSIEEILSGLNSEQIREQINAIKLIDHSVGCNKGICDYLINLLYKSNDPDLEKEIKNAFVRIGGDSVPVIFNHIVHKRPLLRELSEELGKNVYDDDLKLRLILILYLIRNDAFGYLLSQKDSSDPEERRLAAELLGQLSLGNKLLIDDFLSSNNDDSKIFALKWVLNTNDRMSILSKRSVKKIKEYIDSANPDIKTYAILIVVTTPQMGNEEIILQLIQDPDADIRSIAISSFYLNKLNGEEYIEYLIGFFSNVNETEEIRLISLGLLTAFHVRNAKLENALLEALQEEGGIDIKNSICNYINYHKIDTPSILAELSKLKDIDNYELKECIANIIK